MQGKEAVLEIVDRSSEGWGHINIDRIIFSDIPPEPLLSRGTAIEAVVKALKLGFTTVEETTISAGAVLSVDEIALTTSTGKIESKAVGWTVSRYTRLRGFHPGEHGYRVLATTAEDAPL